LKAWAVAQTAEGWPLRVLAESLLCPSRQKPSLLLLTCCVGIPISPQAVKYGGMVGAAGVVAAGAATGAAALPAAAAAGGLVGLGSLIGSWCVRTAGGLAVRGIRMGAGITDRSFQATEFAVDVASSTVQGSGAEMLLGLEGAQVNKQNYLPTPRVLPVLSCHSAPFDASDELLPFLFPHNDKSDHGHADGIARVVRLKPLAYWLMGPLDRFWL